MHRLIDTKNMTGARVEPYLAFVTFVAAAALVAAVTRAAVARHPGAHDESADGLLNSSKRSHVTRVDLRRSRKGKTPEDNGSNLGIKEKRVRCEDSGPWKIVEIMAALPTGRPPRA